MTNENNQPIDTIRDGALKATIWKNTSKNGHFYSVEISRTYKDETTGKLKDSHSFSGSEPLQVARLAQLAYDKIATLRQKDRDDNANQEAA